MMLASLRTFIKRRRVRSAANRSRDPEIRLLRTFLQKGSTFVDVGANIGIYSYLAASIGAKSVLVEPNPFFVKGYLMMDLPNSTFFNIGLADKFGVMKLSTPLDSRGRLQFGLASIVKHFSRCRTLSCVVTTLDSLQLECVDLVKIDVEGAEELVLLGSLQTLDRFSPSLIVEIEERHNPGCVGRIIEFLFSRGYSCFCFELASANLFQVKSDAELKCFDPSRFSNNFIFIRRPELLRSDPFVSSQGLFF